jgi:hypothetical protein
LGVIGLGFIGASVAEVSYIEKWQLNIIRWLTIVKTK